ncbi:MAG: hypothetical protein ABSC23_11555 [Bryobacteraceae bacterium]|jgi:hypothetical protein
MSGIPGVNSTAGKLSRPMVIGLFVSSCLLSAVSWFTTQAGMKLYLAPWAAMLASVGVQSALVLTAWLVGVIKSKRSLLIAVYAITATVSISFSYVALYTWFSARARPAAVQRKLYDALNNTADRAQELLAASIAEGQKHVVALDEMAAAEESHGWISRAQDADPFLARVREAVALEAQTYSRSYREGAGEGLRYTAFNRYAKLARETLTQLQAAQVSLASARSLLKPLEPTEEQLQVFRRAYETIPWAAIEEAVHHSVEKPPVPSYADFVDRSVSGQEDLILAFQELITTPSSRHISAFALAAFIDIIVFLLAYASGPHVLGIPHQVWLRAGAALDGRDERTFIHDFLGKLTLVPGEITLGIKESDFSPGERQFCAALAAKGLMMPAEHNTDTWILDGTMHEELMQSLATRGAASQAAATTVDIRSELDFVSERPEAEQPRLARILRPAIRSYLFAVSSAKDLATEAAVFHMRAEREIHLAACVAGVRGQIEGSRLSREAKSELEAYIQETAYEEIFDHAFKEEAQP